MAGNIRINPIGIVILLIILFTLYKHFQRNELISLRTLLSVSVEAARRGGDEVVKVRSSSLGLHQKSKGKTKEGADNPVTRGDYLSHQIMSKILQKSFYNILIVSEEDEKEKTKYDEKKDDFIFESSYKDSEIEALDDVYVSPNRITVWIDPLDATQEYTENLLDFVTTMVCVAVDGKPILGIIHRPFSKLTHWAWVGPNVYSSNLQISQSKSNSLNPRLIVSRSHAGNVREKARLAFGHSVEVTAAGGAGFKVLSLINGSQDVYLHSTLIKKWDICAGNALLEALGGHLTQLDGSSLEYTSQETENQGGVLASLSHHSFYIAKFKSLTLN